MGKIQYITDGLKMQGDTWYGKQVVYRSWGQAPANSKEEDRDLGPIQKKITILPIRMNLEVELSPEPLDNDMAQVKSWFQSVMWWTENLAHHSSFQIYRIMS